MTLTHDLGGEDGGGGRQRVHGRVDTQRRNLTRQLGGGVEVGERGERSRVGVVVGGHVHGLQRRDRTTTGGGDALLQLTHLVGQGGLVTHGRRHAAEQSRHLGTGLHETEDVVDEQQHVLVLHIAEVLGHGERRQSHAQAHARRFVHLAEDQGGLLEHARLFHFHTEVGALAGALTHAGEHRHTTVLRGHTVDHLGDENGLAHAGATEQTDLSTGQVRGEQVDDLHAGDEHALLRLERREVGSRAVDVPTLHVGELGVVVVEHLAPHVPHVTQHAVAHGHLDAVAGVAHRGAATQTVGGLHADGAHAAVTQLLGHLGQNLHVLSFDLHGELERAVQLGEVPPRELDVDHGAGDADDLAVLQFILSHGHGCLSPDQRSESANVPRSMSRVSLVPPDSASAPPTISMISVVIAS
ncbi:unannotated protein [freshwater metagenome]|uniref:Unannotated protein n=1 Tax=freshwater metagenome TaxID=449393 RepID=A0A6J6F3V8_9ZZZZ